jgi:hypothetical protein
MLPHNAILIWFPLYFITLKNNSCCVFIKKIVSKFNPQCLQVFDQFTTIYPAIMSKEEVECALG